MADLAVATVVLAGLTEPAEVAAAGGGDTFTNDGKTFLKVTNGSGGGLNVVANAVKDCDQGFDHDNDVTVGAGATVYIGPFPKSVFNGAASKTSLTYPGGVTSLTLKPISVA